MKLFTSKSQKIGQNGENITCMFLVKQGYEIVERNYTRKFGEIDIIAKINKTFHFIEVKSISVSPETLNDNLLKPEDNMHKWKQRRLARTIEIYLSEKRIVENWQFDIACVYLDILDRKAKVIILKNIILDIH